jgi:hypothetical protein
MPDYLGFVAVEIFYQQVIHIVDKLLLGCYFLPCSSWYLFLLGGSVGGQFCLATEAFVIVRSLC